MAKTQTKGLGGSKGVSREPFAKGYYKFEVKEADHSPSKSGFEMHTFVFGIEEAPEGEERKRYTHRFVIDGVHDFMVDRLKDFLNATGVRVASDDTWSQDGPVGKTVYGLMTQGVDKRDGSVQGQISKWYDEDSYNEKVAASEDD